MLRHVVPQSKKNTNIVENYILFLKYSCFWMENATHVDGLNPAKSAVFWWSLSTDFPFHSMRTEDVGPS